MTIVMAGLVPAIHVFVITGKTWMPGTRPGMTDVRETVALLSTTQPMLCSAGKVSINQLLSWVKTPARKAIPVSTSNPPMTRSTWAR